MGRKGLDLGPVSIQNPNNPAFYCGLACLMFALFQGKWRPIPAFRLILLYSGWCLLTDLFRGENTNDSLKWTLTNEIFLLLFLFGASQILLKESILRWNVYIYVFLATLIGLYCTYEHSQYGFGEYFARYTFWQTKGRLGDFFLCIFSTSLGLLIAMWRKPFYLVCFGTSTFLSVVGLLFSYDRTAYLGMIAACGVIFLFLFRRGWIHVLVLIFLVCILALLGTRNYLSNNMYEIDIPRRIRSIFDVQDATLRNRVLIWEGTLKMIAAHPWIGVGEVNYFQVYREFKSPKEMDSRRHVKFHAHNIFLHAAATKGIPGAVLFSSILWVYLRWLWGPGTSRESPLAWGLGLGALAAFSGHIVAGLGDVPRFINVLTLVLQLVWAHTVSYQDTSNISSETRET